MSEKGNKGNGRTKRKYCYKESVSSTFYFKYLNSLLRHYIQTCAELKEKLVLFIIPTIKSLYTDFTSDSDFSGMLFVGKRLDRNNTLCLNRITIFQEINLNQINQIYQTAIAQSTAAMLRQKIYMYWFRSPDINADYLGQSMNASARIFGKYPPEEVGAHFSFISPSFPL